MSQASAASQAEDSDTDIPTTLVSSCTVKLITYKTTYTGKGPKRTSKLTANKATSKSLDFEFTLEPENYALLLNSTLGLFDMHEMYEADDTNTFRAKIQVPPAK